ncbi:bifunctional UDP-N-acetylglucosamine diphosphorylase/glucosamine-1-phosphate N-acetyltransferase GlmU [Homoserinibacter sp. GY 40078]|uniref:bifunctional UDP-N-acetylglucosamine diphosphorylase/glucosamine-1-phosphate N-acetyltransferase GlmU n=1 Tax=Homoserinibacter sp. GY 40078 TaxID=2603275 RepID=UPI0011C6FFC7|nr:bifunctional UDP-N-acetylglucosamine diphosphorylase/glucosamine-1-phosphate N-acetyltransferase GlmU [Homoserinibacter sp. GY 40078]TXK19516.1 bifunctional UDP-N-acetylglucosamine diphosphorylase/glucosamine-1-phosphate N-acetyltransferase GlmU [Homoserinibacter sp. GY 40078]
MTDPHLAVIVLAAGEGTRMRSRRAKVLHPIAGLPMVAHVIATARHLDPAHIEVVVRHQRDAVVGAVEEYADEAIIVDQDDVPGTGRAVELAVAALPADFDGDVVVVSGDVPLLDAVTLGALVEQHRAASASATILSAVLDDATGYGRIVRDDAGGVAAIVEHKDADEAVLAITEINSGSYVFRVSALREHLPRVGTANAQGEKYLTDVVAMLRAASDPVMAMPVTENWRVAGVNDRAQLAEQAARLNAMIVRGHQLNGVTILDPSTTWIDLTVSIGQDTEILPNTRLAGATTIERDAVIGPDTTLVDCEVGEGAVIKRTDATLAVVKAFAEVGPFAYLRPGTELEGGGKIGTFVETKNAHIGRGSKVPHLSYIGDTEVGEGSNVGAGTITANYDGVNKHRTTVGSHVRTGSHNVFVAPVTIGDGAYTGAGTVVRKDVPAGSLAMNVAPQRNLEGWVAANRPGTAAADAAAAAAAGEAAPTAE